MKNSTFFSIIIPTYNRGDFIFKTIESLLSQKYTNYEIIIVDDGSTDNTEEIVKNYLSDNIFYFKKTNGERAAARNFGTIKARGEYVNFFDSDDLATDIHLMEASTIINNNSYPEVFHLNYVVQDIDNNILSKGPIISNFKNQIIDGNPFSCNGVFIRKDIALENPFNETRELSASEDYELWLRLASKYEILCSSTVSSIVIQHDNRSVTSMKDANRLIARFTTFIRLSSENASIKMFLGSRINYFKMRNFLLLSVELADNGFKKSACKFLFKACTLSSLFIVNRTFFAIIKRLITNRL